VHIYQLQQQQAFAQEECLLLQEEKEFIADKKVPIVYAFPGTTA
jgi:hypothetical protein